MFLKLAVLVLALSGWGNQPNWAYELISTKPCVDQEHCCVEAAYEARDKALKLGISEDRLEWLLGVKPFTHTGHVSLLVDGKIVVDNGGLGRNLWREPVCPGQVCTISEARRAYDLWKRLPATSVIPLRVKPKYWGLKRWPQ